MKTNSILKSYKPLKRGKGFKVKHYKFSTKAQRSNDDQVVFKPLRRSTFSKKLSTIQVDIRQADSRFSKLIINRDKKCLRCGTTYMLTCSHFHGRANYATRFEPLNCITLCTTCHDFWESKKSTEYLDFMINWLKNEEFSILDHLSKLKISKEDSLILVNNLFKRVEKDKDIQY